MNEVIEVTIRWDWDGLSLVTPSGPVIDITVSNIDTAPWTALFPNKSKGDKTFSIPATSSQTYSGGVLNTMGLSDAMAVTGFILSRG
jgi:hypothetical protein